MCLLGLSSAYSQNTVNGTAQVTLSWTPLTEYNVRGYYVYRSTDGQHYIRLTPTPITSASYIDTNITGGEQYYYKVTAVDTSPIPVEGPETIRLAVTVIEPEKESDPGVQTLIIIIVVIITVNIIAVYYFVRHRGKSDE